MGILEIQTSLGGKYQDWAKVTPRHDAFISKILNSTSHIITTVRRKQDYEMVNSGGRLSVQKTGTTEITRDGFEYELDINFEVVNENHLIKASKDRTGLFVNKPEFLITEDVGKIILDWCNKGASSIDEALEAIREAKDIPTLTAVYNTYLGELKDNKDFMEAIKSRKTKIEEGSVVTK